MDILFPILIFLFRIVDVTFGTVRIIFISRGYKMFAALCGFFEVLIWITIISKLMRDNNSVVYLIAYAAGFAAGNFVGLSIAEKLSVGVALLRIVVSSYPDKLIKSLREMEYGVTVIKGKGAVGEVEILFIVIKKKDLKKIKEKIKLYNPKAFYSIENIDSVSDGVFPKNKAIFDFLELENVRPFRKGK